MATKVTGNANWTARIGRHFPASVSAIADYRLPQIPVTLSAGYEYDQTKALGMTSGETEREHLPHRSALQLRAPTASRKKNARDQLGRSRLSISSGLILIFASLNTGSWLAKLRHACWRPHD